MSDNEPLTRITLRLPASLHDSLTSAAAHNNRSMNAEIVARIKESLDEKPSSDLLYTLKRQELDLLKMESRYHIERALAYRFANALNYVQDHGQIPTWHEPGTMPLMTLVEQSLIERKDAYYQGKELISRIPALIDELREIGKAVVHAKLPEQTDAENEPPNTFPSYSRNQKKPPELK